MAIPGRIQNKDIQSSAELAAKGGSDADLPNDDKIYITGTGLNKTLKQAVIDGDLGPGAGAVLPTGMGTPFFGASAPSGWILASGNTIGNASSGGTERANADTSDLFDLLWNSYSNTLLPIQDSTGAPSTRGGSSASDFAANKRMPVPDLRGRAPVGKDNMGGSAAGRMTTFGAGVDGVTLGASGGTQTHTLNTTQMPIHTHGQNSHGHLILGTSGASPVPLNNGASAGLVGENSTGPGDHYYQINAISNGLPFVQSTVAVNQNSGSGGAHNNTQPSFIANYILKL